MTPTSSNWPDHLTAAVRAKQSPLVVGLDPRRESLPGSLRAQAERSLADAAAAFELFCREVIDAVTASCGVVKPQAAFFEQLGPAGAAALASVVRYARERGLLVILDGKRNDIGSTAAAYADGYLGADSPWGADALTVSPYLGEDSLSPFVELAEQRAAGLFVLVKTSNPGSGQFQDQPLQEDGRPLYEHVAAVVESLAARSLGQCQYGAVGAVVGATYPQQLAALRRRMPHAWLLVPGYGAQGGSAADVAAAFDPQGLGAVVNSSRGVIFAYQRPEYAALGERRWQDAVAAAARRATDDLLSQTPAQALAAQL